MVNVRRSTLAAVVLLTLIGFALRLFRLDHVALRGDEAFTVIHWMREPLAHTLSVIATTDPHPPLAYAAFRFWALIVGASETTSRLLPALLGVIGVPAIYALGRRLGGKRVGLVAAFLWAVHPYAIWHAQDARNYAIWSSFSLVAAWLAVRALETDRRRDWLIYVAAAAVAAYFYYLELFTLVALTVYAATSYWGQWRRLSHWIGAMLTVGVLLALWFVQPRLLYGSGYGGTTGGFAISRIWLDFLPTLTFGQKTLPPDLIHWLWLPIVVVSVGAVLVLRRRSQRLITFAVVVAVIPVVLLALVSLKLNVFEPRYILGTAPAYILLIAAFVIWLTSRRDKTVAIPFLGVFLFCLWFSLDVVSLRNYWFVNDYAKSPDWKNLVIYLKTYADGHDEIVQAAADEAFNFYYDEYGMAQDRKQLPANPKQSTGEIDSLLQADVPTHRSFWRVAQTFTDWPNYGVVESWLAENMQLVRDTSVNGLRAQQYMPWQPRPDELAPAPRATFGDAVTLVGAHVLDPAETPGKLTVWLYWRPLAQTKTPLKIFVQLIGAPNPSGSPLWTQDDHFPQEGRVVTTTWLVNATYRDVYELPLANVPAGDYTVITGLYDPAGGARLPVGQHDYYSISPLHLGK